MILSDIISFRNNVKGDVGLEFEYEYRRGVDPVIIEDEYWRTTGDGSLRNGVEYVLSRPIPIDSVEKCVKSFMKGLDKSSIRPTYRAGTHVHINVRDLTPRQIINYFVLYVIFEQCLIEHFNPQRRNNLFCLTTEVANGYTDIVNEIVRSGNVASFDTDTIRYSSINLKPVRRYGSVEFRALESTTDVDKICGWVRALYQLKEAAKNYDHPVQIMEAVSAGNLEGFTYEVLGRGIGMLVFNVNNSQYKIRTGIINAQDVCYAHEWCSPDLYIFRKGGGNVFTSS